MLPENLLFEVTKNLFEHGFKKVSKEELSQINKKLSDLAEMGDNIANEVNKDFSENKMKGILE